MFQPDEGIYFVTFRLDGSLPEEVIAEVKEEQSSMGETQRDYFGKFDEWLDKAQSGNKWLADERVAYLVSEAIRRRDRTAYDLICFCIMPNHVHVVFEIPVARDPSRDQEENVTRSSFRNQDNPKKEGPDQRTEVRSTSIPDLSNGRAKYPVAEILRLLKGSTAREANKLLKRTGPFWQHESYDRLVRDEDELERVIEYVIENPVNARLVTDWESWKWTYLSKDYSSL